MLFNISYISMTLLRLPNSAGINPVIPLLLKFLSNKEYGMSKKDIIQQ